MDEPLPAAAVDGAIDWYVRLAGGQGGQAERAAFSRWQEADVAHAEAWRRVQSLGDRVTRSTELIAPPVVHHVLDAAIEAQGRRRLLKTFVWTGVGGSGLWLLRDPLALPRHWDGLMADASTSVGERRDQRLPDGSRLRMNTDSALDIRFDRYRRRLVLHHGEIEVTSAADPARRPLSVETADGRMMPIGTRFGVRYTTRQGTLLTVSEGAVEVRPNIGGVLRVDADQQLRFDAHAVGAITPIDEGAVAWTRGLIVANRMRLGDFVAELARYRSGWLRCDPAVAELRLTAVHPLVDAASVDVILTSLQQALPVRVSRLSRYWTTIVPR